MVYFGFIGICNFNGYFYICDREIIILHSCSMRIGTRAFIYLYKRNENRGHRKH